MNQINTNLNRDPITLNTMTFCLSLCQNIWALNLLHMSPSSEGPLIWWSVDFGLYLLLGIQLFIHQIRRVERVEIALSIRVCFLISLFNRYNLFWMSIMISSIKINCTDYDYYQSLNIYIKKYNYENFVSPHMHVYVYWYIAIFLK